MPAIADDFPSASRTSRAAKSLLDEAGQSDLTIDLFAPNDTAGLPEMVQRVRREWPRTPVSPSTPRSRRRTYWGDEYLQAHLRRELLGHPPFLNQVAAGSLKDTRCTPRPLAAGGFDFDDKYKEALAETVDTQAQGHHEMQKEEYDDGGNIIPFFQTSSMPTTAVCRAWSRQPNVLNLDHFGRGLKPVLLRVAPGADVEQPRSAAFIAASVGVGHFDALRGLRGCLHRDPVAAGDPHRRSSAATPMCRSVNALHEKLGLITCVLPVLPLVERDRDRQPG